LQIVVIENHMKGKDTHVRGVRVLGPIAYDISILLMRSPIDHYILRDSPLDDDDPFPFTAREYKMYQAIR